MFAEYVIEPIPLPIMRLPVDIHPKHKAMILNMVELDLISESLDEVLVNPSFEIKAGKDCFFVKVKWQSKEEIEQRIRDYEANQNARRLRRERQMRRDAAKEKEIQERQVEIDRIFADRRCDEVEANRELNACLASWTKKSRKYREGDLYNNCNYHHIEQKRDRLCILPDDEWNSQRVNTEFALSDFKETPSRYFGLTK